MTHLEKIDYLTEGGWIQNRHGWWHPPNCIASFPLEQAMEMAKRDEDRGLRMSREEVDEYLRGR